jgi:pentatricopeptide repeat protein
MYAKCGALDKASRVFQRLRERDVVAWSALIGGYVEHGQCDAALEKFGDMRDEGVRANGVTYIHVLRACGSVGALGTGREIHAEICGGGELTGARKKNPLLGTALVGMYARCGAVDEAAHALQSFCGFFPWGSAGIGAWNALLAAYAQAGELRQAIRLFEQMGRSAVADDDAVSLLLLLAACAHAGIVDAGHAVLGSVLEPSPEHLTCAADLFARAGRLDLALALLDSLPPPHRPPLLAALLGACRNLSNLPLASLAFEELVRAHPRSAFAYVCMRNIYCTA